MKRSLLILLLVSLPAVAVNTPVTVTLNGLLATTSTSAAAGAPGGPVATGQASAVDVYVWSAAGGTYTVLLEEKASDTTGAVAPWITIATMANCTAAGAGTVTPAGGAAATGPCGFSTLAPKQLTRLRISAWTSGTVYGVIHLNAK